MTTDPEAQVPWATNSLRLEPFAARHARALYDIMRDEVAMRHTYVAPSQADCSARLQAYETMRATLGFAPWVVSERASATVIGWGGLSIDPDEPEWGLEVSYALSPAVWGRGYATELVQASLALAFGVLRVPQVQAFAKPQNTASLRVLDKCGFALLRYEERLQRNHYTIGAQGAADSR